MKVKCIHASLNHIVFGTDGSGNRTPHRVKVGETFSVKKVPANWAGLVTIVEEDSAKVAVVNPKAPPPAATAPKAPPPAKKS